jgi:hypothetical protein
MNTPYFSAIGSTVTGLFCLKVKLRGDDAEWDYDRVVRVGRLGLSRGVLWLSADFNCR